MQFLILTNTILKLWCWYRTLHRYLLPKREMSKFSPSHLKEFINTTQIGKSFACQFREYNMRIWSLPNLNMDLEPNLLKPIWTTINFFPRGKCIPVITGQRLLDRQESEGRIDGFLLPGHLLLITDQEWFGVHIFDPKFCSNLPQFGMNVI